MGVLLWRTSHSRSIGCRFTALGTATSGQNTEVGGSHWDKAQKPKWLHSLGCSTRLLITLRLRDDPSASTQQAYVEGILCAGHSARFRWQKVQTGAETSGLVQLGGKGQVQKAAYVRPGRDPALC